MVPILIGVGVVVLVGLGVWVSIRRTPKPVVHMNEREERLANAVAGAVGCNPADALAAVREELDHAPNQSDDVLTKRAAYHYRRAIPEKQCSTYRDASPG